MGFKAEVTTEELVKRYGKERVVQAQDDLLNDRHNSLCWFFIADYCKDTHCNPHFSHNYDLAKDLFYKLIKEI